MSIYPSLTVSNVVGGSGSAPAVFTLTADATPHDLGAWVEVVAAIANPGFWVRFGWYNSKITATDTSTLLDIGVSTGGGGEVVKIPQIGAGFIETNTTAQGLPQWSLPMYFPAGQAIHARIQSAVVSHTITFWILVFGGGYGDSEGRNRYFSTVDTFGASVSTSNGLELAGTTAGSKGAWVEIVSAIPNTINGLALSVQLNAAVGTRTVLIDIGRGSGGNEVVVLPDVGLTMQGAEEVHWLYAQPVSELEQYIEKGERLSARFSANSNGTTGLFVHLHGLRY